MGGTRKGVFQLVEANKRSQVDTELARVRPIAEMEASIAQRLRDRNIGRTLKIMDRLGVWLLAIMGAHQFGAYAIRTTQEPNEVPPVELLAQNGYYVLKNDILSVTLSTPSGMITKISYNGIHNLLEEKNKEDDRGYWDIQTNAEDRLDGTEYKIVVQNENQVEVSFTRTYNSKGGSTPINIDKRFVMLRGVSGFYTYTVLERLKGWPSMQIGEARVVFKLQQNMTYFMAVSDTRQRQMPTEMDREKGNVLDYKEAVQLVNPSNPDFNKEVDDKYFYSCDNKDNNVHGWVSLSQNPIGFWMITPSNEFRIGGPFKQDLTSHTGPTVLNMFVSSHYTGMDLSVVFKNGEAWKKVLGPVFVYLNSNPQAKSDPSILWADAKTKMSNEAAKWPYDFPNSPDFVKSNQRGVLRGRLLVLDRYVNRNPESASLAYVGLAPPGVAGSWQRENKGYQFWTVADSEGNFIIKNVIAGIYSLYASVPQRLGDYIYKSNVVIKSGSDVNVGSLIYEPPRNGPTLWEIGIPDRTAAEFFIPKPKSNFKVHVYKQGQDKFREYGLWKCYSDLYPKQDLVFSVGTSDYTKDWFFVQVTRLGEDNKYVSTTWKIIFDLPELKNGHYTLQLALASATRAELQVRFNDEHVAEPLFTTGEIGEDNAVARHGIHGLYWCYSIDVVSSLLIKGRNTVFLKQARGGNEFTNIMYDYIRLEAPQ